MVDLGYETHNQLLNLGSLAIFLWFYLIKVILYLILMPCKMMSPRVEKLMAFLRKGLFFNELVGLLIESYFEMLISTYLQLRAPLQTASGEIASIGFSYITIFLILVFLPGTMIWALTQPTEKLKEDKFKESWEDLYSGMKTNSKWEVSYYLIFISRRVVYVAIAFLFFDQAYQ